MARLENGEGLIWDSEVKVEIQEPNSGEGPDWVPPDGLEDANHLEDGHGRILESHIEIKVDVDRYSFSAAEPSSPLPATSKDDRSQSSSIATSPRSKRYGQTFSTPASVDFDHVDDESDDDSEGHYSHSPLSFRGRPLVRGKDGDRRSSARSGKATERVDSKTSSRTMSRLKSLRNISSPFRHLSKSKDQDKVVDDDSAWTASSSPASGSRKSRNPFRVFRTRKTFQPIVDTTETIENKSAVLDDDSHDSGQDTVTFPKTSEISPLPSQRRSLKDWKPSMFQERKDSKNYRPRDQSRSLAPSPTGSWSRNHQSHLEDMELPILESPSQTDTAFDSESLFSDFEEEGADEFHGADSTAPAIVLPSSPSSFHVNSMRAKIEGLEMFDLGFGDRPQADDDSKRGGREGGDDVNEQLGVALVAQEKEPSLLEPERIISMYGDPKEHETGDLQRAGTETETETEPESQSTGRLAPASRQDGALEGLGLIGLAVGRAEVMGEGDVPQTVVPTPEKEDSRPISPHQGPENPLATRPEHPPRESSLRRLTGFYHARQPTADCDVPMPKLVSFGQDW